MTFRCGLKDCASGEAPTHLPTILIWAEPSKMTVPAALEINLGLCSKCAATAKPEQLLSEKGKLQIEQVFVLTKKAKPDWTTAELRWRTPPRLN